MNFVFLVSIVLKGIGAILEVLLQICITSAIGVEGYGTYAAWINGADLIFWVALSGLIKFNTFYLSGKDTSLQHFKKRYYFKYALPALGIAAAVLCATYGTFSMALIPLITGLELFVLDRSSSFLARGEHKRSLFGEYVLGRMILLAGVLLLQHLEHISLFSLLGLYIFQYVVILLFFFINSKNKATAADISQSISIRKWFAYQQSDLMHSMIEQMPVVIQFIFSGAFEAGVVSIVLLVKKLINFISGPTAKIFLPEFSKLYHAGNRDGIRNCYHTIMHTQMLAVGPLAVVLIGYPSVVLRILASELLGHRSLFVLCSVIFLLTASLGPCGGILQMTGNEKKDNQCRAIALAVMVLIMYITRDDKYFVLYGLCGQVAFEAIIKFVYVCRWMRKTPVKLAHYVSWWLLPIVVIAVTYALGIQESFAAMVASAALVFTVEILSSLRQKSILN